MEHITTISNVIIILFTALTGVLTFIEKSQKIKWKPLSRLFNSDTHEKLDKVMHKQEDIIQQQEIFRAKLDEIEDSNDVREIKRLRAFILNYANEKCEQGIKKSQEQETYFDECCVEYENLIKKHKLTNGHTVQSIKLVSDYRKLELQDMYRQNVKFDK